MKRHAMILTVVLAATAAGGVLMREQLWSVQLPPPESCSREQLLGWLVMRDLNRVSHPTRVALVDRLQTEILLDPHIGQGASSLSRSQRDRLLSNARLLRHVWFVDRVNDYHDISSSQQKPFLDRQIETLVHWPDLRELETDESSGEKEAEGSAPAFFTQLDRWIAEAGASQQKKMRTAVDAALQRWLTTHDLSSASATTRHHLATRIADELTRGRSADETVSGLSQEELACLQQNARLLLEAWFLDRVEEFSQLPDRDREPFVEEQMSRVKQWGIMRLVTGLSSAPQESNALAAAVPLMSIVAQWIDRADPSKQPAMREMVVYAQRSFLRSDPATDRPR